MAVSLFKLHKADLNIYQWHVLEVVENNSIFRCVVQLHLRVKNSIAKRSGDNVIKVNLNLLLFFLLVQFTLAIAFQENK